jgi:hypothetical protein
MLLIKTEETNGKPWTKRRVIMDKIIDRLPKLREEQIERLPNLEKKMEQCEARFKADFMGSVASAYRFLGVAAYVLEKDIQKFRDLLLASAELEFECVKMYQAGQPVSKSYVSVLTYQDLFSVLASGDIQRAKELAELVGFDAKIDKKEAHPFDRSLGYCLKAFVLEDMEDAKKRLVDFTNMCGKKGNKSYTGYAEVFQSILDNDNELCDKGIADILKGHKRIPFFRGMEDEVIAVWCLGIANLAIYSGLDVNVENELLPRELLIG